MGERLSRSGESYSESPRHVEKLRNVGGLENRLNAMAAERGHELDVATSEHSAEWILFQRLMYLLVEESQEWDAQQRAGLRQIVAAFGVTAFPTFTEQEQHNFSDNFRSFYEEGEGKIQLDHTQAGLVSRIGQRVNISSDPEETTFTFDIPQREEMTRITEVEDPTVKELLDKMPPFEDGIWYIFENISKLTLKQKVQLLFTLSDEEYAAFKRTRKAGFADVAEDVASSSTLLNPEYKRRHVAELIRRVSNLRNTTPRYEVETDLRREWKGKGKYPSEWDKELEEDQRFRQDDGLPRLRDGRRISYEEAIEFAKSENARNFYRNYYFPSISNRYPISLETLGLELQEFEMKGPAFTMKDLLSAIQYYLDYEPDNEESCEIHRKAQRLVGLIVSAEEEHGKEIPFF